MDKREVQQLIQNVPTGKTAVWAEQWLDQLLEGGRLSEGEAVRLLEGTGLLNKEHWEKWGDIGAEEIGIRWSLYQLIAQSKVTPVPFRDGETGKGVGLTAVVVAVWAEAAGYLATQYDSSSPPGAYTPASEGLQQAAQFIRQLVDQTVIDWGKLEELLGDQSGRSVPEGGEISVLVKAVESQIRPPIPVRYPEYDHQIGIEATELTQSEDRLVITVDDLPNLDSIQPETEMIRLSEAQTVQLAGSRGNTELGLGTAKEVLSNILDNLRHTFALTKEEVTTVRLGVDVREQLGGIGLVGVQIRIKCRGIKHELAGVTDGDGLYQADLPVPLSRGVTYDVRVYWPRGKGGGTELKSITLQATDRDKSLPFFLDEG